MYYNQHCIYPYYDCYIINNKATSPINDNEYILLNVSNDNEYILLNVTNDNEYIQLNVTNE